MDMNCSVGLNSTRRRQIRLGFRQFTLAVQNPAGGIEHGADAAQLRATLVSLGRLRFGQCLRFARQASLGIEGAGNQPPSLVEVDAEASAISYATLFSTITLWTCARARSKLSRACCFCPVLI